jgi:glucose-1-phosphate thymidylyltransferase
VSLKGIVLAGGTGSRLMPLTKVTNKHLLPIGNKPMILYPIEKLTAIGITEILIITGAEHIGDVVKLLGSGNDLGCNFTYKVQDQAGGIAEALALAAEFSNNQPIVVILGDNIFEENLKNISDTFLGQKSGARIILKEVKSPERFGVAEIEDGRIISIEEKPQKPKSNYIITGIYFYYSGVFDIIKTLKPSARGELEITDVNQAYLKRGEIEYDTIDGWWTDAGTFKSLARANELVEKESPK